MENFGFPVVVSLTEGRALMGLTNKLKTHHQRKVDVNNHKCKQGIPSRI